MGIVLLLWRRKLHRVFPIFFAYTVFEALEEFTLYAMDILPSVTLRTWWLAFCVGLIIEGVLNVSVMVELFSHFLHSRPVTAKRGKLLITISAAILVLLAVAAAAYAPMDHPQYVWTYRGHVLLQSFYIVEGGLALFLFLFAAYNGLTWNRKDFGIALGFGILFCEHMATWSIMATGALPYSRYPLLDFLNMATYHVAVIIWCYYLLAREKVPTTSAVSLPENNLAIWNRELERLLQR
ncbi:MAG: hypothetical protein WAK56_00650 [Candidatus Sulfotelmatobacter sp.]